MSCTHDMDATHIIITYNNYFAVMLSLFQLQHEHLP